MMRDAAAILNEYGHQAYEHLAIPRQMPLHGRCYDVKLFQEKPIILAQEYLALDCISRMSDHPFDRDQQPGLDISILPGTPIKGNITTIDYMLWGAFLPDPNGAYRINDAELFKDFHLSLAHQARHGRVRILGRNEETIGLIDVQTNSRIHAYVRPIEFR
jgi:hypothetical protein